VSAAREPLSPLGVHCPDAFAPIRETTMRGILLWLIGIPIPIIILLYLFGVF
jgi:hypothetical protein